MTKTLIAAVAFALLALPASAATRNHAVALKNIRIKPTSLKIHRGDSVTWTWGDQPIEAQHNVTSFGKHRFRSSSTKMVGTHTVRFTRTGTYTYHCTIHDSMKGRIIVR